MWYLIKTLNDKKVVLVRAGGKTPQTSTADIGELPVSGVLRNPTKLEAGGI